MIKFERFCSGYKTKQYCSQSFQHLTFYNHKEVDITLHVLYISPEEKEKAPYYNNEK